MNIHIRIAKILFIISVFLLGAGVVHADTTVSRISEDTEFTLAGSPYVVSDTLVIPTGVTLTIDPGVEVSGGSFVVDGMVKALGIVSDPIHFTSTSGLNEFTFRAGSVGDFEGSYFHNLHASAIWTHGADLNVSDTTFDGNEDASVYFQYPGNFTHTNNHFTNNAYNGFFVSGTIDHDQTFSDEGVPYIFSNLSVAQGATLTIDPGVVVKGAGITVDGILNAIGTVAKPIVFTSLKDDTVDGDTNNDGSATTPDNMDWSVIEAKPGGVVNIAYATVKYGGLGGYASNDFSAYWPMIGNWNGTLNLNHVTVGGTGSWSDIHTEGETPVTTITNSKIIADQVGIKVGGGTTEIHESSITGDGSGILLANIQTLTVNAQNNWWGDASGPGNSLDSRINFTPWLTSDPFSTSTPSIPTVPVIIIPGILGSAEVNGVNVIDPILHVYDDFIATFEANGYVADKTIFPFPYDWRNSNINTAQLLRIKINQVKQICGCDHVDLVGHSMGGLVARQYIESPQYQNDVRDVVFIGTPHLGAPEDYLTWEGATHAGNVFDVKDFFLFRMIEEEGKHAGYSTLFDYIQNSPITSLKELLPIYPYKKDENSLNLESYGSVAYTTNPFLENLDAQKSILNGLHILNVVGDTGLSTVGKIVTKQTTEAPLWKHGEPVNLIAPSPGLINVEGDGTVPLISAESFGTSTVLNFEHKDLVDQSSGLAFKFLNNQDAKNIIINPNKKNFSYIFVRLFSPVDSLVIAPDGKRVGKDPVTGQDINEVDGAYFTGSNTDNEFVVIPDPLNGTYVVQTQGKGEGGAYTVSTSYISDATSTDTTIQGVTYPGLIQIINFQMSSTSSSPIVITASDSVTASSTIDDITRAYSLGWIKKLNIENELLNKMNKVLKAQAKIDTVTQKVNGKNTEKKVARIELVVDKKLGAALLVDLRGYTRDKINLQAYNLIRDDILYLIDH